MEMLRHALVFCPAFSPSSLPQLCCSLHYTHKDFAACCLLFLFKQMSLTTTVRRAGGMAFSRVHEVEVINHQDTVTSSVSVSQL